jgi:hypothetical protein
MTTTLLSLPGAEWLLTPYGIGALVTVLMVVFSGLLGRIVLLVETVRPGRTLRHPRHPAALRR